MERIDILKARLEMASHNLLCYSSNYLMSVPKLGHETDWQDAQDEIALLEQMIKELNPAAGPWQFTEPHDGKLYLFKQVKANGTTLYHVGWGSYNDCWNSMGMGPIRTKRIVAWAPLYKPGEVPNA